MRFNAFPVQKRIMWPLICLIDPHHRPTNHTKSSYWMYATLQPKQKQGLLCAKNAKHPFYITIK